MTGMGCVVVIFWFPLMFMLITAGTGSPVLGFVLAVVLCVPFLTLKR